MRDTELYRHVLGVESPWEVNRVKFSTEGERIDVWVDHPRGTRWKYPECDRGLPTYDHAEEWEWRHLDTCQFLTYLHARPPRVECPEHGVCGSACPGPSPCPASPFSSNDWRSMCFKSATCSGRADCRTPAGTRPGTSTVVGRLSRCALQQR
ncbi:MAG: transposase family protein [Acidimicrobiales bacterium]